MGGANSVDHIIPHARGGLSVRANLQAAHASCNLAKNSHVRMGTPSVSRY
jgi:5-methylcytosine-specific restriction endonuclease McrA